MLVEYTCVPDEAGAADDLADEFIRLACLNYGDDNVERRLRACRLLAEHPQIGRSSIFTAATNADADEVRRRLADDPSLASAQGGPFRWTALFHLAYARHDPDVSADATLATARAVLEHGADPNAGYLWHGLPSPFTVLTGAFGSGEQGPVAQPQHPHARALARLLLEAGADPNDGQALYNRMFRPDNDHIELLFEFGSAPVTEECGSVASALRSNRRPTWSRPNSGGPSFTTCGSGFACSSSTAPT